MWLAVFAGVKAGEVAASSFINWAEVTEELVLIVSFSVQRTR